jgi:tRNA-specific 2-thiouridylase
MAKRSKIVVGLSGGVDSSVAALRLLEAGHEVSGLFMKNWEEDDHEGYCAALADLEDAQAVSDRLGIPLHTVNFSFEYWERVFTRFLEECKAGLTPNPDILCNREIK